MVQNTLDLEGSLEPLVIGLKPRRNALQPGIPFKRDKQRSDLVFGGGAHFHDTTDFVLPLAEHSRLFPGSAFDV